MHYSSVTAAALGSTDRARISRRIAELQRDVETLEQLVCVGPSSFGEGGDDDLPDGLSILRQRVAYKNMEIEALCERIGSVCVDQSIINGGSERG